MHSDKLKNKEEDEKDFIYKNKQNLIQSSESYCFTLMDYFKKLIHYRQIDLYAAYSQMFNCFSPKELNESAKIRKRMFF